MTKAFFTLILCCFLFSTTQAQDTTWVQVHNQVDMTWYGHYKQWGQFPEVGTQYRKVLMHYTMGCASTGCSGWDYDTHILLNNITTDSTNTAPNFIYNQDGVWAGMLPDSISYSTTPTYYITTDTIELTYDTIWNPSNEIVFLGDGESLFSHIDTIDIYATNYVDSFISLGQIPYHFTVNSAYQEFVSFSFDTTYQYIYDDSVIYIENDPLELIIYNNLCLANDTLLIWPIHENSIVQNDSIALDQMLFYDLELLYDSLGNIIDTASATLYYNETFLYDSLGNISDTIIFYPDTVLHNYLHLCGWEMDSNSFVQDSTIYSTYTTSNEYFVWGKTEEFEIARNITPYGTYMQGYGSNGYDSNWEHVYTFDVTDYQHLLTDSVELDAFYAGWSSGFSVTLDFEFIEGTPPRDNYTISNVYYNKSSSGYFGSTDFLSREHGLTYKNYSNSTDFETNQMPASTMPTLADAKSFKLQFVPSGHGQSGEFTSGIFYYANVNNNLAGSNEIWKDDCGFNAIYPQGGTWIFDRANWCPGEAVPIFNHEITPYINPGDSVELDIDFTTYSPSSDAGYSCAVQFFQYGDANFNLDAEVSDIITPSLKDEYSRLNPYCGNPIIKIRNAGAETLTSLTIEYNMRGGATSTFEWLGSLDFLEEEEVTLDAFINNGSESVFEVTLSNPNGNTDEYNENNYMATAYEDVPVHPESFVIVFKTNNNANENSWRIQDDDGNILYSKSGLLNGAIYKDTVLLSNGCYQFILDDNQVGNTCNGWIEMGKDGLDFWYWGDPNVGCSEGSGQFISFRNLNFSTLKNFNNDFGSKITHHFRVEDGVEINEDIKSFIEIHPNPTSGVVNIESNSKLEAEIFDILGEIIWTGTVQNGTNIIDISDQPNGTYLIQLQSNKQIKTEKIILNR